MPLAAGLMRVLEPEVVEQAKDLDTVELWEKKRDVNMRVRVVGLPAEFLVIRTDHIGHVSKVRGGPRTQMCDYLIIAERGGQTCALFVELKKTQKTGDNKPREQLRRSLPILEYLRSMWEIDSETLVGEHGVSVHYSILFERTSPKLAKQPVKTDPSRMVETESYKGLTIRTFVGTSVSLAMLTGE